MKNLIYQIAALAFLSACSSENSTPEAPAKVIDGSNAAVERDIAANQADPVTASGQKVDLSAIKAAFEAECAGSPVVNGSCKATASPAEFACDYALKGDNVFSMKNVTLVEAGETFKLKEVPNHCTAQ